MRSCTIRVVVGVFCCLGVCRALGRTSVLCRGPVRGEPEAQPELQHTVDASRDHRRPSAGDAQPFSRQLTSSQTPSCRSSHAFACRRPRNIPTNMGADALRNAVSAVTAYGSVSPRRERPLPDRRPASSASSTQTDDHVTARAAEGGRARVPAASTCASGMTSTPTAACSATPVSGTAPPVWKASSSVRTSSGTSRHVYGMLSAPDRLRPRPDPGA
jgi:hypothetical protein